MVIITWNRASYTNKKWVVTGKISLPDGTRDVIRLEAKELDVLNKIKQIKEKELGATPHKAPSHPPTRYSRPGNGRNIPASILLPLKPPPKPAARVVPPANPKPIAQAAPPANPKPPAQVAPPKPIAQVAPPANLKAAAQVVPTQKTVSNSLAIIAKRYSVGLTKTGLEMISKQYDYQRIAGDGHCLFRAIGQSLLNQAKKLSSEEREKLLYPIVTYVSDNPSLNYEDFQQAIINGENSASDNMVLFLRRLSCIINDSKKSEDVFKEEAERVSGSVEQYLQNMSDMKLRMHGGESEIDALSKAFNLTIFILDVHSIAKKEQSLDSLTTQYHSEGGSIIHLLHTPNHYDVAIPLGNH